MRAQDPWHYSWAQQGDASLSQLLAGTGGPGLLAVIRSPLSGSAVAATATDTITIQSPTQSWWPPYVGLDPLSLGQGRVDTARLLGKRLRDDQARPTNTVMKISLIIF